VCRASPAGLHYCLHGGAAWLALSALIAASLFDSTAAWAQCAGNSCTVTIASDPGTSSRGTTGAAGTLSYALAYANAQTSPVTISRSAVGTIGTAVWRGAGHALV